MAKSAAARFAKFVEITDSCHLWTGAKSGDGYGAFGFNCGQVYAHRFSYEANKGAIPAGFVIDHLCRNHACVNPDHLEAVTPGENIRRGVLPAMIRAQKAQITSCPAGHTYDAANTYTFRGKRHCKKCVAASSLLYAARNREKRRLAAQEYRNRKKQQSVQSMDMR